jgi:hypothetical protein
MLVSIANQLVSIANQMIRNGSERRRGNEHHMLALTGSTLPANPGSKRQMEIRE